ncbi:hypothetical protein ACJJIW_08195 [Microbulbifer sp. JMSA004]|uniref:hypothetical protein n=1 Tax=Microbulbifer sp. JMSA004 TaxID=3243370 RepID=UPI0040396BED
MKKGILFTVTENYNVEAEEVLESDVLNLTDFQYLMTQQERDDNPNGYLKDGEQIVIAKMRRKKVLADLAKLGLFPGCKAPEYAYYVVYGQPNVRNIPPSLYYEIEQTFEDMGWEFTGCPHADNDGGKDNAFTCYT